MLSKRKKNERWIKTSKVDPKKDRDHHDCIFNYDSYLAIVPVRSLESTRSNDQINRSIDQNRRRHSINAVSFNLLRYRYTYL